MSKTAKTVTFKCSRCGNEKTVPQYRFMTSHNHYCSNACRIVIQRDQTSSYVQRRLILKAQWRKQRVKVAQYSKDGDLIKDWDSIADASIALNISQGSIGHAVAGRSKTSGGYIWKRVE